MQIFSRQTLRALTLSFSILGLSTVAQAVVINGTLTTDDHLTNDGTGDFYYDVFNIVANDSTDIILAMSSDDFGVWSAAWDQVVLPSANWMSGSTDLYNLVIANGDNQGAVGSPTTLVLSNPNIGQTYQFIATTSAYAPTTLGDYSLEITTSGVGPAVSEVTASAPASILLSALVALGFGYRRARSDDNS